MTGTHAHWEQIYSTRGERAFSWFEENPTISLDLVHAAGLKRDDAIIDIGCGQSRLADALLDEGFSNLTVLDISQKALQAAQARLGPRSPKINWIAADVISWEPPAAYDLWHDRACFHFFTEAPCEQAYAACVSKAVKLGGHVIIGTFAPEGPERCSGLPVKRHDAASLSSLLGKAFALVETRRHDHATPLGKIQRFQSSLFQRIS